MQVLHVYIALEHFSGPNTSQRILIAKLSLSASGLSYDHLTEIRSVINRLEVVCSVHCILNRLCDCSFLYWHQISMLPVYFSKLIETKADLNRYYVSFPECPSLVTTFSHSKFYSFKNDQIVIFDMHLNRGSGGRLTPFFS